VFLPDIYAIVTPAGLDFSMHFMDEKGIAWDTGSEAGLKAPVYPGSVVLRRAIRGNIVSFPSQIPIFLKQPTADVQWRVILLFFVRGWSSARIAKRFNVPSHRIWEILSDWSVRALALGYVQVIDPEAFSTCCHLDVEYRTNRDAEDMRLAEVRPVLGSVPQPFPDAALAEEAEVPLTSDGMRSEGRLVDSHGHSVDLLAALDVSVAHCEEWRDEFWVRAATLLRDKRTAAAAAVELRRSTGQADQLLPALPSVESNGQQRLSVCEEEQVSHAVA
jgi:hypothetical protein